MKKDIIGVSSLAFIIITLLTYNYYFKKYEFYIEVHYNFSDDLSYKQNIEKENEKYQVESLFM